jgi:hypothetical protein
MRGDVTTRTANLPVTAVRSMTLKTIGPTAGSPTSPQKRNYRMDPTTHRDWGHLPLAGDGQARVNHYRQPDKYLIEPDGDAA